MAEPLSVFHDLAMGETAATEAERRWNAEGARNAPFAKSLEKQEAETWKWKEELYPLNAYEKRILLAVDTGLAFHFVSYLWLWFPPAPMARDRNDFF